MNSPKRDYVNTKSWLPIFEDGINKKYWDMMSSSLLWDKG